MQFIHDFLYIMAFCQFIRFELVTLLSFEKSAARHLKFPNFQTMLHNMTTIRNLTKGTSGNLTPIKQPPHK